MSESTLSSCGRSVSYSEERTANLYRSIVKSLQEVDKVAAEVNSNYKKREKKMDHVAHLITAIQAAKGKEAVVVNNSASDTINE